MRRTSRAAAIAVTAHRAEQARSRVLLATGLLLLPLLLLLIGPW